MGRSSLPRSSGKHPYVLRRVRQSGSEEFASGHPTFEAGWAAGQAAVHADREGAFALYGPGGRRVARFGFNRIAVRGATLDWSVIG